MKQLYILAFLLSSCSLFAQDYKPMAVEGAAWVYAEYYYDNPFYFGHQIKGDSTINGLEYKVVYSLYISRNDVDSIDYLLDTFYPAAFVRDDIQEKTVHIIYTGYLSPPSNINCETYDPDSIREYTIYDFNVEIGDYDQNCDQNIGDTLVNITETNAFGFEVLEFSYSRPEFNVMEQIGTIGGFFLPRYIGFTSAGGMELVSYCITDDVGCPYYLGPLSNEEITKNDQVKIFPNPSNTYFHLESEEDKIQSISIYTLTGQRIYYRSEINNISLDINVSEFSFSGNLFAIIELEDGKLTRKHLVIK